MGLLCNVAMNINIQAFVWTYIITSLGCIPSGRISVSYGNSMINHLKICQALFQVIAPFINAMNKL